MSEGSAGAWGLGGGRLWQQVLLKSLAKTGSLLDVSIFCSFPFLQIFEWATNPGANRDRLVTFYRLADW